MKRKQPNLAVYFNEQLSVQYSNNASGIKLRKTDLFVMYIFFIFLLRIYESLVHNKAISF